MEKGLAGYRAAGNRHGEIEALAEIGEVHLDRGQLRLALTFAEAASQISREINVDHIVVGAAGTLASCQLAAGELRSARLLLVEMLKRASMMDFSYLLPRLLISMSKACLLAGDADEAQIHADRALALAEQTSMSIHRGEALVALARVHSSRGVPDLAVQAAVQAVKIQRRSGYRLGEAEALAVLSQSHPDPIKAAEHQVEVRAICSAIGANPYWFAAFQV